MNEPSSQSYSLLKGNLQGIQQEQQKTSRLQRAGKHALIWHPCSPLCCPIIHNRTYLPRHGNSSWVTRKADTKPPLIKKPLQVELSSGTRSAWPPDEFNVSMC